MRCTSIGVLLAVLALLPVDLRAQPLRLPPPVVEATAGYAGFADDGTVGHTLIGGALRVHVLPRVSIGPEVQYLVGPDYDRDLILTANVIVDMLPPGSFVTPYLVAGGGLFRHSDRFGSQTFSSTEGAFTAGGGLRAWLSERVYVASDFRAGWELHYRISGTLGISLARP